MNSSPYFSLLMSQGPLLMIYVGGIIVCAILARRAPLPAMLAIGGCGLMVLATLMNGAMSLWIYQGTRAPGGMSVTSRAQVMSIVGLGATVIRGGGLALLIAGVFVQRVREDVAGFDVEPLAENYNAPQSSRPPLPPLPPRQPMR